MKNILITDIRREAVVQLSSVEKAFMKFGKIHRKTLVQNLFFNKVADLRPATLIKKRLWHRGLPVNFEKFLRAPFLTEHLWWLLLLEGGPSTSLNYRQC